MKTLNVGLKGSAAAVVNTPNTAAVMKSGSLPVFATPAMCALMEEAACDAVSDALEAGKGSVGTALSISHDRATALGDTVTAVAELVQIEGRKLSFLVSASDSKGIIGKGTHERFIIDNEKFMAKVTK